MISKHKGGCYSWWSIWLFKASRSNPSVENLTQIVINYSWLAGRKMTPCTWTEMLPWPILTKRKSMPEQIQKSSVAVTTIRQNNFVDFSAIPLEEHNFWRVYWLMMRPRSSSKTGVWIPHFKCEDTLWLKLDWISNQKSKPCWPTVLISNKFSVTNHVFQKSDACTLLSTTALKNTRHLTGQMDCAK
jgi:hypothetical protein